MLRLNGAGVLPQIRQRLAQTGQFIVEAEASPHAAPGSTKLGASSRKPAPSLPWQAADLLAVFARDARPFGAWSLRRRSLYSPAWIAARRIRARVSGLAEPAAVPSMPARRSAIRTDDEHPAVPNIGQPWEGSHEDPANGNALPRDGRPFLPGLARRPRRLLLRHLRSRGPHRHRHAPVAGFVPTYRPSAR